MAPGRPRPAAAADARYKDDDAPDNDQDWHKDDEQEEEGYDPDTNETRQRNHATAKNKTNASNKTKETLSSATTTTGNSSRSTGSKRHKLRRVNFDAENDDLDFLPSHERATEAGGYMHTKNSRWKISQANKGKMPWNKGKNRSDTAKAKISAGVRARNRALLLDKLTALNMSEEEWLAKKRQIKLLRERVRKAKLVAEKHQQQLCHHQLQTSGVGVGTNTSSTGGELTLSSAQIHSQLQQQLNELVHQISVKDEYDEDGNDNSNICLMERYEEPLDTAEQTLAIVRKDKSEPTSHESNNTQRRTSLPFDDNAESEETPLDCQQYELMDVQDSATDNFTGPTSHSNTQLPQPPMPHMPVNHNNNPKNLSLFAREVIWTPHAFDLNNSTTATTTTNAIPQYDCPTGGPGGLICCHACAEKYSQFLTETIRDIETAKMQCGGREVQELLDMTKSAKETLARTIKVARRKPVPMRKQPKLQQLPQQQHSLNSTTSQNQRSPLPAENIVENLNASIADHQMLLGDELLQVAEV